MLVNMKRSQTSRFSVWIFMAAFLWSFSVVVGAQTDNGTTESNFTAYKPNFAIFSYNKNDDTPLQVRLSARYKLLDCEGETYNFASDLSCRYIQWPGKLRMYFSYTTDFDFYLFSEGDGKKRRQSRPVRNRMTSPALHFNWERQRPESNRKLFWSNLTTSLVHHSNGQDIEYEAFFTENSTADEILATISDLEESQPSWMDSVSRGWNYLELQGSWEIGNVTKDCGKQIDCVTMSAGIKHAVTSINDEIWWEPGNNFKYTDYNRVELTFSNEWETSSQNDNLAVWVQHRELALQLQCGDRGCSTKTWLRWDLRFGNGNLKIPLLFYGHFGRNEHFYNYHETNNSIGIGLQFRP